MNTDMILRASPEKEGCNGLRSRENHAGNTGGNRTESQSSKDLSVAGEDLTEKTTAVNRIKNLDTGKELDLRDEAKAGFPGEFAELVDSVDQLLTYKRRL